MQYRNTLYNINVALNGVSRLTELSVLLTTYYSRHAWVSIAKSKNIPLSVIGKGMKYDSEENMRI